MSKSPLSLEGWNAHDAHEMLGWRHFERGGARNGARALAQAMYDSMYHQPGIGGPDNLSRLHLRAQSQIDHTRTVRLRIVRITAQGRDWCLVLGLFGLYLVVSQRFFTPPSFGLYLVV